MRLRGAARRSIAALALAATAIACRPDFDERSSRVSAPRILAVRGSPPEARPGDAVDYDVLVATPDGTAPSPSVAWAFCASPKPLTENGVVSTACLAGGVRAIAASARVSAATPSDACSLFGPDVPPGGFRPRDPDATGGYFLPVRAIVADPRPDDAVAFGLERLVCDLANASADAAGAYRAAYVPNRNPTLAPLVAEVLGAPVDLAAATVARGARVTMTASWGDAEAERYVSFDVARQAIVPRRESMRVSWFATDGLFDEDRTGRGEDDLETSTANGWVAPSAPSQVFIWIVLRDGRGGVDFSTYRVDVR